MFLNNIPFRTAQLWPNNRAIDTGRRTATWAETLDRTRRLASSLAALAPDPADRIALLGVNGAEYLELTLAVPLTGRPMMTMNYRLSAEELLHTLTECPCRVLCFDAAMSAAVAKLRPRIDCTFVFWGDEPERPGFAQAYERLVAEGAPIDPPSALSPGDVWAVVPSGGTTGLPKAIELSYGAMAFTAAATQGVVDLGPAPRGLHVSPMFHLAGLTISYAVTGNGGTHAFLPAFSVDGLLAALSHHRSTVTNLVPTMISWLVARSDLDRYDLSALRNMFYGASAISLPTLRKLRELFPSVALTQFYGQTEACGALACLVAADHSLDPALSHRLRSAGRPLPGIRVEVTDAEGRPQPPGQPGEICARTDALFRRYVGHDAQTAAALRDGWLRTGDVGYLDEDGFLYVTDRLKDMIVTGGENVSASEVEDVLAQHPRVIQVAVVAAPDELWGEHVHAYVVVAPEAPVGEAELDALCRGRLALFKIPRGYTIGHEPLPQSGAGKVSKVQLRRMLAHPVHA